MLGRLCLNKSISGLVNLFKVYNDHKLGNFIFIHFHSFTFICFEEEKKFKGEVGLVAICCRLGLILTAESTVLLHQNCRFV